MKKIFFVLLLLLNFVNLANAETKLRVGYVPGTGFLYDERANYYSGYGYEYMEFLSKYGDWEFEYIPCTTWQECNEKLQSGAIDVLPAMPGDYRSLQNVVRTDHVVGRYPMKLITQNGEIKSSMRLGTIPSNPPLPSLPKVAQNEGFSYELVNFPLFYDMEEAFKRGEIDGYISAMLEPNKEKNVASIFDRQSYRLLVRPDRQELLSALNIAMDEMLMDQPNIRNRLNDKYLRGNGSPLILNRQEKEYLTQKKVLKTAILMKDKPYAYQEHMELFGVIPRVIMNIASDLNVEIEIIDTKTPAEAANLIKTGQVDFIADAVCDFSWAETLNMSPTQSYLQLEYVPVKRRGSNFDDLKVVACDPELLYTKNYIFPIFQEDNRIYEKDLKSCFRAVSEGRADVLYAPRSEVQYLIEETGTYNLEVASESDFSDSISLGVYNGADSRLWKILNKEVNHLDIAKIHSSVNEEMSAANNNFSLLWTLYRYPLRAMLTLLIFIGIIAAAIWYRVYLRRKQTEIIQHMAYTDLRYNLPNLSWLEEQAPTTFSKIKESEENGYIVNFVVDNKFGNNLVYDKELQNEQVKNMAEQLNECEWVLLTSTGDENGSLVSVCKAKNKAEISRLTLEAIRNFGYIITKDSRIWLHMKAGICKIDEQNLNQSINNAQIACNLSKDDILIFDDTLQEKLNFEQQVEENMEEALKNGEFQSWYQPEYDLQSHETIGNEAFVRWQSSKLGFLLPDKFIHIFERNGFILPVDYFMLEEVCKLQRRRLDEKSEVLPISVNQSMLHLTEEDYIEKVKAIFNKYNLPKGIIKLEFKETAFENLNQKKQLERVTSIIHTLQKVGFKIAIDDFGSGYSSYRIINRLAIDEMKIDRTLIETSTSSSQMKDILSNIIELGKKLKMQVICEGIESQEQEELLINLGCKYGQGFLNADLGRADK